MVQNLFKAKKRLISFLLLIVSFLFILQGCGASSSKANDVKFPSYTGYINDYSGILDESSKSSLEELAAKIKRETGSEIAVVIVDNLQGLTEEEYAVKLFEEWEIGKEKDDNGILILIGTEGEPGTRPLRIEVGYGLEGVITDLEAGRIVNDKIVPNFIEGYFYAGLNGAIITIADQIYEEKGLPPLSSGENADPATAATEIETPESSVSEFPFPWGLLCCFPIPLIAIIVIVLFSLFRRRCPKCRKFALKTKTTILKAATYTETGRKLIVRNCSNCGYSDSKESTIPKKSRTSSHWTGGGGTGGGRSSGSGGFGGFGGGSSGGGGASGKW
jgi:uncharacterized protein